MAADDCALIREADVDVRAARAVIVPTMDTISPA